MLAYDVIVIGAGHAGSEAAGAAALLGSKTLLITMDMTKIAQMSCNPAMGGIAKGQIVREIDALGGYSGIVTDESMIQFRMLNRSKGPAMWSPRAQCDRMLFTERWRQKLESIESLHLWQDAVKEIIVSKGRVSGVVTSMGVKFRSKAVIITSGTFMNGLMHIGKAQKEGGRAGEPPSAGISTQMDDLGFKVGRMKTGTPARIDGRSVDFGQLIEQKGDSEGGVFSYLSNKKVISEQRSCYIAHTDEKVHDEIRKGIKYSPLFDGTIKSIGPRYCPSIEDKIVTFKDKEKHQLFIEPEGWNTIEYYINGFSSSLPWDVQYNALRKIKGLENVRIFRPGYAIEYDYFDPTQIKHSLETKEIENLYFAGQVNGTTGYEEAAAQGIMAGINAHLKINDKDPFILERDQAYIGVLIDDLVTKGVDEPYRMFTSRAEFRMLLRQDNADERLTGKGYQLGLAHEERWRRMNEKYEKRDRLVEAIRDTSLKKEEVNPYLNSIDTNPVKQAVKAYGIVKRTEVRLKEMMAEVAKIGSIMNTCEEADDEIIESAEIEIKYSGYVQRENSLAEKIKKLEYIKLGNHINYNELKSLSTEARAKLNRIRPANIGQASRISGVSPADISVLLIYLGR